MDVIPPEKIAHTLKLYPDLPQDYIEWLKENGWGEHEVLGMVYEQPIPGDEICPEAKDLLVIGDNMAGFMYGFVRKNGQWEFRGLESCGWKYETFHSSFSDYVAFMERD